MKDEWISVEDRLPELDRMVLVCVSGWGAAVAWYAVQDGLATGVWCSSDIEVIDSKVTYWCALPKLPDAPLAYIVTYETPDGTHVERVTARNATEALEKAGGTRAHGGLVDEVYPEEADNEEPGE